MVEINQQKIQPETIWLVGEPTHLNNMLVKLDHFPKDRGENKKYLKPPPSNIQTWAAESSYYLASQNL